MIELLIIKAFAVFFFVSAWLSIIQSLYIHELWEHSLRYKINKFLANKPWNCGFCMSFWVGCLIYIIPVEFCYIPAIAGIASLLFSIKNRLETLIA